jgi:hypothetical protein
MSHHIWFAFFESHCNTLHNSLDIYREKFSVNIFINVLYRQVNFVNSAIYKSYTPSYCLVEGMERRNEDQNWQDKTSYQKSIKRRINSNRIKIDTNTNWHDIFNFWNSIRKTQGEDMEKGMRAKIGCWSNIFGL